MAKLQQAIEGDKILGWLDKMMRRYPKHLKVVVGYEADYALAVHENIEMAGKGKPRRSGLGNYWDPSGRGQAKFLEQPAREHKKDIAAHVLRITKATKSLPQGLLSGARILLVASQHFVPVEYGELKASGFYRLEEEVK